MKALARTLPGKKLCGAPKGFTLAELLVASTLLAIVMAAAYTAFSTQLRVWRRGEQGMEAHQDARTALTIMGRELQSTVARAAHLFEGDDDEFEFFAVVPPMDVDEGSEARVMWIRYRVAPNPDQKGDRLIREEAVVESPLPLPPLEGETMAVSRLETGRKEKFELATRVLDFGINYYWVIPVDLSKVVGGRLPPPKLTIVDEHEQGWGLPQGIEIALTLADETAESGQTTFTTFVSFRGETTQLEEGSVTGPRRAVL